MPELDLGLALAGLFIGFIVGLTGMGGGALMTPVLVLFFGVAPLAAVSSDLVVSLVMKPVGGAVHLRRGTVNRPLVAWLVLGSVPCAFLGVLLLRALGEGDRVQEVVKLALGAALLLAATTIVCRTVVQMRVYARTTRVRAAGGSVPALPPLRVRPAPTVAIGALGGLVVGMTSVGSGSLIIVLLLLVYPTISSSEVVGTDLVQAVPLVGAAALGHLLFGEVSLDLTASLLVGALPGVYVGARASSRAPQGVIRRVLVLVLYATGLKLVGLSDSVLVVVLIFMVLGGPLVWSAARRRAGLPARRAARASADGQHRLFFESLAADAVEDNPGGGSDLASSGQLSDPPPRPPTTAT